MNNLPSYIAAEKTVPGALNMTASLEDAELFVEEIEAAAEGDAKRKRFSILAYTGKPMSVGGFPYPVVVDLAGMQVSEKSRPILKDHNPSQIVGHSTDGKGGNGIKITSRNIRIQGEVSAANEFAREIVESAANEFPWQASIGASVGNILFVDEGESEVVNGRRVTGPIYVARRSQLKETSFVALGADDDTVATIAASHSDNPLPLSEILTMKFADFIKAMGLKLAELTDAQVKELKAHFKEHSAALEAATAPSPQDPAVDPSKVLDAAAGADLVKQIRAAAAAETSRISEIGRVCKGHPDLEAKAISEGLSAEQAELSVLKAERVAPAVISKDRIGEGEGDANTISASLAIQGGMSQAVAAKHYGEKAVDAADGARYRALGISGLMHVACQAAGLPLRAGPVTNDTIRAAFAADQQILAAGSGFSTVSLSGILSNIANKSLLAAYEAVADVTSAFVARGSNNDFKKATRYRMTIDGGYSPVGPAGELKSVSMQEESYEAQVGTEGAIVALTRQMMINDDLGAFLQIPRFLGRAAAISKQKLLYTLLLANPGAFFSVGNGNLLSGAGSALSIEALSAAEKAYLDQTDVNGDPVSITPSVLLVPTGLKVLAEQLFADRTVNERAIADSAVANPAPNSNPHAGKFTPVASPYLNSQTLTGSSDTAWYLFGNPNDVAAMEVTYLNGRDTPFLETAEADFNTLGMQWRSFHDIGVSMQDYRAAVKNDGA